MQAPLAFTPGGGRPYGDLGAVTGLAGDRGDLHRAVGDLRHLQREQLLDQARVRPGQRDLRAAEALGHVHHDALDPLAVLVRLAGHLLGLRQHRLELAQVDADDALLGPGLVRLDDAGDQVAVAADVLAEVHLVGGLAQPLQDDLLGGHRGDPAEVVRGVVPLPDHRRRRRRSPGRTRWPRRSCGRSPPGRADCEPSVCRYAVSSAVSIAARIVSTGISRSLRQGAQRREVDVHASSSSSVGPSSIPVVVTRRRRHRRRRLARRRTRPSSSSSSSASRVNSICTRPGPSSSYATRARAAGTSRHDAGVVGRGHPAGDAAGPPTAHLDQPADVAPPVPGQGQRAVDPGRADLERVRVGDQLAAGLLGRVQGGRDLARDVG